MTSIASRLQELGLELPEPMRPPAGVTFRFERAVGVAELPFDWPVAVESVVALRG